MHWTFKFREQNSPNFTGMLSHKQSKPSYVRKFSHKNMIVSKKLGIHSFRQTRSRWICSNEVAVPGHCSTISQTDVSKSLKSSSRLYKIIRFITSSFAVFDMPNTPLYVSGMIQLSRGRTALLEGRLVLANTLKLENVVYHSFAVS